VEVNEFTPEQIREMVLQRTAQCSTHDYGRIREYAWLPTRAELSKEIGVPLAKLAAFMCGMTSVPHPKVCGHLGIERIVAYRDRATQKLVSTEEFIRMLWEQMGLRMMADYADELGVGPATLGRLLHNKQRPGSDFANLFGMDRIWAYVDRDPARRASHQTRDTPGPPRPRRKAGRIAVNPTDPIAYDAKRSYTSEDVRALFQRRLAERDLLLSDVARQCRESPKEVAAAERGRRRAPATIIRWLGLVPVDRRDGRAVARARALSAKAASGVRIQFTEEADDAVAIDPATGRKLRCDEIRRLLVAKIGHREYPEVEREAGATMLSSILTDARRPSAKFIEWLGLKPIRRRPTLRRLLTGTRHARIQFPEAPVDKNEPAATDGARIYSREEVREMIAAKVNGRPQTHVALEIGIGASLLNNILKGRARASKKAALWLGLLPVARPSRKQSQNEETP
jgi:hypothetical protein